MGPDGLLVRGLSRWEIKIGRLWIALTHWLAQSIYGEDAFSDTVRDKGAASLYEAGGGASGEDAATARERLQEIRKRIGNSMQLAPFLMTRENMANDRVPLLGSKQIWREHGPCPVPS